MIVVTASTGLIGQQVLNNLLKHDEPIRVIVRDPSRLPAHIRERVEVAHGHRVRTERPEGVGEECAGSYVPLPGTR